MFILCYQVIYISRIPHKLISDFTIFYIFKKMYIKKIYIQTAVIIMTLIC